MGYFVKIYGCQYNEWAGEKLKHFLSIAGLIESSEQEAGVIFAIACSVRQTAVDRLIGKIRNWITDGKKVIICGCLLPKDKKKIESKGIVFWDGNYNQLIDLLELKKPLSFTNQPADCSYLPIMSGCNNFCSYCVVPYVKGREKSRPIQEIVSDFKKMIDRGQKEILLLGQNVNSYRYGFAGLLKTLNDLPGDFIFSFISNHPKDMTDDIIKAIAKSPKVKKEIHLPLQSGSNKILKAMNRPYTKGQYLKLVNKIKKTIPNVKISTDIIVGFPGETGKDFQETSELLEKIGFYWAFINKYSPREGTAAYRLGDPVPWGEKQRRWKILDNLVNKK